MSGVIVTVKRAEDSQYKVVEVPLNLTAAELALMLSQALNWHIDRAGKPIFYQIETDFLQRRLYPDESLQNVGVLKGTSLILHPVANGHEHDVFQPGFSPGRVTPTPAVSGWRSQTPAALRFNPLTPPAGNPGNPPPVSANPYSQNMAANTPAGVSGPTDPNPGSGPITGWKPLGLDLPPAVSQPPAEPVENTPSQSPFKWKKLDD